MFFYFIGYSAFALMLIYSTIAYWSELGSYTFLMIGVDLLLVHGAIKAFFKWLKK